MDARTRLAKAMAHPLRRGIMLALTVEEPQSPQMLARLLGDQLYNLSYHVKRLQQLGQIELVKEQQVRGAVEHFYSRTLAGSRLDAGDALEEITTALRARALTDAERLDRVAATLHRAGYRL